MSDIFEGISFECPICFLEYNQQDHYPYMVCRNQHSICRSCLKVIEKNKICPICRQPIREEPTKFRLLAQLKRENIKLYRETHQRRKSIIENDTFKLERQLQKERKKYEELEKRNTQIIQQKIALEKEVRASKLRDQGYKGNKTLQFGEYQNNNERTNNGNGNFDNKNNQKINFSSKLRQNNEGVEKNYKYEPNLYQGPVGCHVTLFLDPQCYYIKDITKQGAQMVAKKNVALFGKKQKRINFKFHVEIILNNNKELGLGIIDSAYKNTQHLDYSIKNWITYQNRGWIWDGNQVRYEGRGFKPGQIVTVSVNTLESYIQWLVGTESICKCFSQNLYSLKTSWVPFIAVERNDRIKIWVDKYFVE